MRGIPNNPVPCEICGAPGYPKNRRCKEHWPPTSKLKYPFDAAKDAIVRATWQNPKDYKQLTPEIDEAVRRIGYPRHIVRMRAQALGLTFDVRHKWTPWEEQFLLKYAGSKSKKWIARRIGHGYTSTEAKMHSLGLRTALHEGMTALDLTLALGVCHATVMRWEARGILRRSRGRFRESAVRAFVARYPSEYDLRKVDQSWFKALLFPSAECFLHVVLKDRATPQPAHHETDSRSMGRTA